MLGKLKQKLQPARSHIEVEGGGLVADIDALIEKPAYVKLHGNIHMIRPMLVQEFWAVANALAEIQKLPSREKIALDEMIDKYYAVIKAVCHTITREDIVKCTQAQIGALLQRVYDHVNGVVYDEEKKKTLMKMTPLHPTLSQ
jgi:hypothetical protein